MSRRLDCPACQSLRQQFAFDVKGYAIVRCHECGSLFVRDVPDADQIQSLYLEEGYYQHSPDSVERIQAENRRRCQTLRRLTEGRNLLDVGCAAGFLLDAAKTAGFDACGVDQTPHTVAEARRRGHRVTLGTLNDVAKRAGTNDSGFDAVTALDVIEHVPDPCLFLQQLVDLTRPGGIVVLSTPNYSGLVARLMGRRDPYLIPPEHLNFFTISGLHALAARTEVHVERLETFGRLTKPEIRRLGARYLPSYLKAFHQLFGRTVGLGIRSLNLLKFGVELEVYLRKPAAARPLAMTRAA